MSDEFEIWGQMIWRSAQQYDARIEELDEAEAKRRANPPGEPCAPLTLNDVTRAKQPGTTTPRLRKPPRPKPEAGRAIR